MWSQPLQLRTGESRVRGGVSEQGKQFSISDEVYLVVCDMLRQAEKFLIINPKRLKSYIGEFILITLRDLPG